MAKKPDGAGRGPLERAPSQHGDKTRSRIEEISQTGNPVEERAGPRYDPEQIRTHDHRPGKSRLFEDREQHDEADKNSEKTRLARDIDRHDHGPAEDELHHRNVQSSAKRKN